MMSILEQLERDLLEAANRRLADGAQGALWTRRPGKVGVA